MRLYIIIGAVLAGIAAFGLYTNAVYQAGKTAGSTEVIEEINDANDEAGDVAEEHRARLRQCVAAGGVYDFENGTCQH